MRRVHVLGFAPIMLLVILCLRTVQGHGPNVGPPPAPSIELAGMPPVLAAGLGVIVDVLTNDAVMTILTFGALWLYRKIAKATATSDKQKAETERWLRITAGAGALVRQLAQGGLKHWEDIAVRAMKLLVDEVATHPGIPSLTPSEIEQLKPYVMLLAKRAAGGTDAPAPEPAR